MLLEYCVKLIATEYGLCLPAFLTVVVAVCPFPALERTPARATVRLLVSLLLINLALPVPL